MNLIRRYVRNILLENIKSQGKWRPGPDTDWPKFYDKNFRSKEVPVIEPEEDVYKKETVSTHGGLSHMIKHLHEWDSSVVVSLAQNIKNKFTQFLSQQNQKITMLSKKGEKREVDSVEDVKLGAFITYLDYINDKFYVSGYASLDQFEKETLEIASKAYQSYENWGKDLESRAIDVSDERFPNIEVLAEFLETGPTIEYEEDRSLAGGMTIRRKCILDLSAGHFAGYDSVGSGAKYLTIFHIQKAAHKGVYKSLLLLSPTKRSASPKTQEYKLQKNKSQLTDEYTNLAILASLANDKKMFITPEQAAIDRKNSKMKKDFELSPETKAYFAKIKAKNKK